MNRRKILMYLWVSLAIATPSLGNNLANAAPGFTNYSGAHAKGKLRGTTNAQRREAARRAAAQRDAASGQTEGGSR